MKSIGKWHKRGFPKVLLKKPFPMLMIFLILLFILQCAGEMIPTSDTQIGNRILSKESPGNATDTQVSTDQNTEQQDPDEHKEQQKDFAQEEKPWGTVFWNTLIVNLTTLTGVLTLAPALLKTSCFSINGKPSRKMFGIAVPAFAAGALFSTACLLILPEAVHMIRLGLEEQNRQSQENDGHNDDIGEQVNAKFGLALLFGFFLPVFLGALFPTVQQENLFADEELDESISTEVIENNGTIIDIKKKEDPEPLDDALMTVSSEKCDCCPEEHITESDPIETIEEGAIVEPPKKQIDYRLISSILIGDGFHNFADGIFIGISFQLCSRDVAIAIMISTVYHEMAQELADFFMLTQHAGLNTFPALVLNFISGLTVTIGGLTILGVTMSWDTVGIILSFSGGVYIHIAASECIPRMEENIHSGKERILSLLCLGLGALPIGLVMMNHSHCD